MTLFADPSFFIVLAVALVPAAVLGLTGHRLDRWGLVVSLAFLALVFWGEPAQLAGLVGFLALGRAAVLLLARDRKDGRRYALAMACALLPLVTYKLSVAAGGSLWGFVGISYVTFKSVQVVIEVRDGLIAREDLGLADWLYFLLFFPQFSSGPIDRSRRFLADAHRAPSPDDYAGMLARGVLLLVAGMVYKFVLASVAERYWVLAPWGQGPALAEIANQVRITYVYAAYLFFDFAGYSLMAMGASYCLGIRCPRNFRAPFVALDIKDFWNRWHVTLSTWFRDFVFMRFTRWAMRHRLVRGGRLRVAQCAFVVNMLVMGAWHGLTPDYLGYGLYHGLLLAGTETLQKRWGFYRTHRQTLWFKVLEWFVTMQLVMLGFAIFSGQVSYLLKGVFNG